MQPAEQRISIGPKASAKDQYYAWLYCVSKEHELFYSKDPDDTRVTVNGIGIAQLEGVDWEALKAIYPFSRFVDMTERNLDLAQDYEGIAVYYGMLALKLLNFDGYSRMALEWNDEYPSALAIEGQEYMEEGIANCHQYVVSKSIVFLKLENGQSLCTQLVNVSRKPRAPVKPFLHGCSYELSKKFMKIGIYAVIFKFNNIPDPFDCILHCKSSVNSAPISLCREAKLFLPGSIEPDAGLAMLSRYDKFTFDEPDLEFNLDLE